MKKYKIWLILGVILLIMGFSYFFVVKMWFEGNKPGKTIKTEFFTYEQYYIPISHFTDNTTSISFSDLKAKLTNDTNEEIYVSSNEKENLKKLFGINEIQSKVQFLTDGEIINKLVEKSNRLAIIPYQSTDSRVKTIKVDDKLLWDKSVTEYPLKIEVQTEEKINANSSFTKNKVSLLTNVGDVILGRHVSYKMRTYNDYTHPWLKMAEIIKKGDITFADLETPLSDQISPPDEGMSFIAPQKSIEGLKLGGVDVVALANNHSTNFGTSVFDDTLNLLKKEGISYVGGGATSAEAYKPLIVEKNGLKWGFVNFNSIIGAINATEDSSGVAKFAIKPWAESDDLNDIARIKTQIIETKKQADIVVAEFHWGVEYEPKPIESQINVAHAAVEAGADLIIGTHPHIVQGMENYQKTPIFYSLGNFIFDQEWSIETKQGIVAQTYFYNKKLVNIDLIPYQIEDYNQPNPATKVQSDQILDRIFTASIGKEYQN